MSMTSTNLSDSRRARGRPRDWYDKKEQNTIRSVDRALSILEILAEAGDATLTELSNAARQTPPTVYRVLVTLEGRGFVEFSSESQRWHIGSRAFLIGSTFLRRTSLVSRAQPILRQLMEATGETANLGIEREGQILFLSQVETTATIRAFFPPGTISPMHSSGIGKALLAHFTPARLQKVVKSRGLEGFTSRTLTSIVALEADLDATRERGFAIDFEERNEGMRCVAASVFDVTDEAIAGISISGPSSRLDDVRLADLSNDVVLAANQLSQALGSNRR
ncbi:MAG: IclR family transcriptional regulator [Aestuariivita sp.]|nr:IclR family transcriptional regulator [Aestuariivita sp.]MCY4346434.1 IclR family transcriptional regulator [Aestuariivita sp.]